MPTWPSKPPFNAFFCYFPWGPSSDTTPLESWTSMCSCIWYTLQFILIYCILIWLHTCLPFWVLNTHFLHIRTKIRRNLPLLHWLQGDFHNYWNTNRFMWEMWLDRVVRKSEGWRWAGPWLWVPLCPCLTPASVSHTWPIWVCVCVRRGVTGYLSLPLMAFEGPG